MLEIIYQQQLTKICRLILDIVDENRKEVHNMSKAIKQKNLNEKCDRLKQARAAFAERVGMPVIFAAIRRRYSEKFATHTLKKSFKYTSLGQAI
jgi:hypothetical protein